MVTPVLQARMQSLQLDPALRDDDFAVAARGVVRAEMSSLEVLTLRRYGPNFVAAPAMRDAPHLELRLVGETGSRFAD